MKTLDVEMQDGKIVVCTNSLHLLGRLSNFSQSRIKNETCFFRAGMRKARIHANDITQEFIDALPKEFCDDPTLKIDSRVHMLMPGWYPCIPGWHLDDVDRSTRADKQPDHITPSYRSQHIMAVVGSCSLTQFVKSPLYLPNYRDGSGAVIYKQWDDIMQEVDPEIVGVEDRGIYRFDDRSLHRGMPAFERGFRFFIRASIGNPEPPADELRFNSNVYLPVVNAGW